MALRRPESKVCEFQALDELAQELRGKKVVTTNGCFDILHLGHIQYLNEAKALGDLLVVGVNSDASVKKLKGPTRPLHHEKVRALQVAALECVDHVVVFHEDTPLEFIRKLKPALHVKGGDYTGKQIPEQALMKELGGEMKFLSHVAGYSTTALIDKASETVADK